MNISIGPRYVCGSECLKQTTKPLADLTDVTLADEDTIPILTDNANRAFQGNVAMQVAPPGGQKRVADASITIL